MRKEYTVELDGRVHLVTDNFEEAARKWDSLTWKGPFKPGFIGVQEWDSNGSMVRDGYVLHCAASGSVYLNPLGR